MSDSKEKPVEKVTPPKKGWSNPALQMMGIPCLSLPSRNWMIFWTVLASIGGGYAYDRYEQKQIRKQYMAKVEELGREPYDSHRLPRKLTVFIAPPPDDFLEVSMGYFRRYVKPVLNSASIDFDILVANKQGDIRSSVSERIRQLRRDAIQNNQTPPQNSNGTSWTKLLTFKNVKELYDTKDVLGFYYRYPTITPVRDDVNAASHAGGVVCMGRGAYKEYIQGVHEGLLGPLEAPQIEEQVSVENSDEEQDKNEAKAPAPFIKPEQYPQAQLAPELDLSSIIRDDKGVPVLFEQPIYVFPVMNVLGFKNTLRKIYNFFTKRHAAEDFSERTLHIVDNKVVPFEYKHQYLAKEEEPLWPKHWVEKGKERNSEWVQEMITDDRVTSRLKVIE
ncbi:hypothetical protein CANTEDRAFT_103890 [Yamadazyma tenuis ATCC 10573]|uniref:Mitochondrial import inner membrane translocase subunit TIM54 n=1 Tax=Candida tenuis (strain ATCC 10573 / BCRC 21748 / CBS 615 / JCM 9827 / NBRC 10315 / NRRL Y-1498 / VKM Y-70) TaxID=590646 RepID=G3B1S2_CANTC|nr:uncharacterized protein CANTEDRAFT_103890 [Yamadazyma tenuis ATCC 10573]EGV64518.1 hypothetical protein CANTEDRAFT_103890 [Yamadazyma tenuis ATCC 10573]